LLHEETTKMPSEFQKIDINGQDPFSIGVLSDTHGLLRPEVLSAFGDVDLILHAGDVGDPDIIAELETIAPLIAVRGNMDYGGWADKLPVTKSLMVGNFKLFIIHDVGWMDREMDLQRYQIVINGHTHRPLIEKQGKVLFLNPGSAGYRRRHHPISIGKLLLCNGQMETDLIELNP
jgi:putative phosphoesterase